MSDFYCAAPWRGLHVNLDGDVRVCCAGQPGFLGNINQKTIDDILSSDKLKEIRNSINQGVGHREYCRGCLERINDGHTERQWHNDTNKDFLVVGADVESKHCPTIVDIRWNNTCNLSCSYCNSYFSSTWGSINKSPVKSQVRPNYNSLIEFISSNTKNIRDVAMLGGEPLLINENVMLLQNLPLDTRVTIITNGAVDFEYNKVFELLSQRKNVHWRISVDNITEQYEYVRHGAQWHRLVNNLIKIKDFDHQMGVHAVYSIYNCTRLMEFRQTMKNFVDHVQWQRVSPDSLNPAYYNNCVKTLARTEILRLLDECSDILCHDEKIFFNTALDDFNNLYNNNYQEFKNHISRNESLRKTNNTFVNLWPELKFMVEGDASE